MAIHSTFNGNAMFEAYKQRVIEEILAAMIEDAKPRLREAAIEAAKAFDGALHEMVDHHADRMVHILDLRINGEKVATTKEQGRHG